MKREVWEKIPPPWFVWDDIGPSEDFYACKLFQKYGFEIKVYTDIRFAHAGDNFKVLPDGKVHTLDV